MTEPEDRRLNHTLRPDDDSLMTGNALIAGHIPANGLVEILVRVSYSVVLSSLGTWH